MNSARTLIGAAQGTAGSGGCHQLAHAWLKAKVVGRDHHLAGFTMWFAGGGFKPGLSYGSTDEFGYHAVENVVSVHDIHATLLHLLGIDYQRFSYKFQGLDSRLTGVEPCRVVHELFA